MKMDIEDLDPQDYSKWVHPMSLRAVQIQNDVRGQRFEIFVAKEIKKAFPNWDVSDGKEKVTHDNSNGVPDIRFKTSAEDKNKYVEVKSVQEKVDRKTGKINYKVTRLTMYDNGTCGNKNFDYLVIGYIHPTKGIIFRSMTHEQCEKAISIGACGYMKSWKGYEFRINDLDDFAHTDLDMYKNLECIKKYEETSIPKINENKIQLTLDFDDKYDTIETYNQPTTFEELNYENGNCSAGCYTLR